MVKYLLFSKEILVLQRVNEFRLFPCQGEQQKKGGNHIWSDEHLIKGLSNVKSADQPSPSSLALASKEMLSSIQGCVSLWFFFAFY